MPDDSAFLAFMTGSSPRHCSLGDLVAALPEVYQPIFRHPELSGQRQRPCDDRLSHLTGVCHALEATLRRPVRVLDLGCAQGYFSLALAERGAVVEGIDIQQANIAVCQALAAEHPGFAVSFRTASIEDVLTGLETDRYDLVLGLSVFHHLVRQHGVAAVRSMLRVLAAKTGMGVFELALASEPVEWAVSQPRDPRQLLGSFAFVHELAQSRTHLSSVTRPLFVASNHYWWLDGRAGSFETWKSEPHDLANGASLGTRRYFFGPNLIVKQYRLDNDECRDANLQEHDNEVAFLQAPPAGMRVPQILLHGQHDQEAWLVREYLPGELLVDRMQGAKPYDASRILLDVLQQLSAMEAAGLYHNDLRAWNVLLDADGHATLIDYGAVSRDKTDCAWPGNLFLSFMIFTHEVLSGEVSQPDPLRAPALNPDNFPEPYRSCFWDLNELDPCEWSFAFLAERFSASPRQRPDARNTGFASVLQAMDEAYRVCLDSAEKWRRLATLSATAIQLSQQIAVSRAQSFPEASSGAGLYR